MSHDKNPVIRDVSTPGSTPYDPPASPQSASSFSFPHQAPAWISEPVDEVIRKKNMAISEGKTEWVVVEEPKKKEIPPESTISAMNHHILNLLVQMGLDPKNNPGLRETPRRVAQYLLEFSQPCDLIELLKTFDYEDQDAHGMPMVVLTKIPLAALCEHHLSPFFGTVDIGYVPGETVVGLSKFARLVYSAGRIRPTIQESLTNSIADAIHEAVKPKGVIVVARAMHSCMVARGANTPGVTTITSAIRGVFTHVPAAREEFFSLSKG